MTPAKMIEAILELDGWKQERLASEIGVAQSSVHRWLTGSEPRGHHRDRIAELYRIYVGKVEPARTIRLAGFVGAGQEVYQFDEDGAGFVEAPPGAVPETDAVEVQGESMLPLYEAGTI